MAEKTTEGSPKDTGNNSEKRPTSSTGSKKVYIIKTQYVEKEAPNGPVQKAKRMLRGFGEGVGAGAFTLWLANHFSSYTPSNIVTIPNSSSLFQNVTPGQTLGIDNMQFNVVSENSNDIVLRQILPNGHLGGQISVALQNQASQGGMTLLKVHNGVVSAVQQISAPISQTVLQNGMGKGSFVLLYGSNYNGSDSINANIIQYHMTVMQNWVAQALSNFQHQAEFVLAAGAIGLSLGAVSGFYKLVRREKKVLDNGNQDTEKDTIKPNQMK